MALREDEPVVRGALRVVEVESQVAVDEHGERGRLRTSRTSDDPTSRRRSCAPSRPGAAAPALAVCQPWSRGHSTVALHAVTWKRGAQQIARAVRARRQRLGRLALARDARDGRARTSDRRRCRRRRHLQPDDLREGAVDRRLVRRATSRRARPRRTTRREVFFALAVEDIKRACDLLRPVWERTDGVDGFVSLEVDPDLAYERDATFEQAKLLHGSRRSAQSLREDPGHGSRARRDRGLDRGRALDQRDAHLLARAPRRRRRGVRAWPRAPRRGRRRSDARGVGRELLRVAGRHRGR